MDLQPVDPAQIGEEEHIAVGGSHKEVLYVILLLGSHAGHPFSTPPLSAVHIKRTSLDVAPVGDRNHHLLVGHHVFEAYLGRLRLDLCPPEITIGLFQGHQLFLDDLSHQPLALEDGLQPRDGL